MEGGGEGHEQQAGSRRRGVSTEELGERDCCGERGRRCGGVEGVTESRAIR